MSWKTIEEVRYIVIHGYDTTEDIGVEEIRMDHLRRGWFDIGFHWVARRNGIIENGRPQDVPGGHARGFNHLSLGICIVGREPNVAQLTSVAVLVRDLKSIHPDSQVVGINDLPNVNKPGPGFDVIEWWANEERT
jgi:N-acetylmuramoyl-L-alanine amidase